MLKYKCLICGSETGSVHHACEMMIGTGELFPYWECSECGCLALAELPEDPARYYPTRSYYSLQDTSSNKLRRIRDRLYLSRASFLVNWRVRTDLDVIRNSGFTRTMSLLDVGCGNGHLLADLRALGFNARGIDPFVEKDIHDSLGVRVERKALDDVKEVFDVVLFRHSLEHMSLHCLRLAKSLLKPTGVCIVCIPLVGWAWRIYGTYWAQLDAPRHLFLHTRRSFGLLAAKSGFEIEKTIFDSNEFQFWASDAYRQGIPLNRAKSPRFVKTVRLRRKAAILNRSGMGDSAQFYLRHSH